MSVITEADRKLTEARQAIRVALKAINEIVVEECWGHDQWNEEFTSKVQEAHSILIKLRRKLS